MILNLTSLKLEPYVEPTKCDTFIEGYSIIKFPVEEPNKCSSQLKKDPCKSSPIEDNTIKVPEATYTIISSGGGGGGGIGNIGNIGGGTGGGTGGVAYYGNYNYQPTYTPYGLNAPTTFTVTMPMVTTTGTLCTMYYTGTNWVVC